MSNGFDVLILSCRHAELVACEAQVVRANLAMITQTNFMALIKEGISIRTSYNTVRSAYKFLVGVAEEGGICLASHIVLGQEGFERLQLDEEFIAGILFINASFSLSV